VGVKPLLLLPNLPLARAPYFTAQDLSPGIIAMPRCQKTSFLCTEALGEQVFLWVETYRLFSRRVKGFLLGIPSSFTIFVCLFALVRMQT
jgi:hypothetical protein